MWVITEKEGQEVCPSTEQILLEFGGATLSHGSYGVSV